MAASNFVMGEVALRSGDRLALFTDGVAETWNDQDEEFGEERIIQLVRAGWSETALELQQRIMEQALEFSSGEFTDDATLMIVKFD